MSNFDNYCNKIAAMPKEDKMKMINDLTKTIVPALDAISEDGENGIEIYMDFLMCAVAADGKLAKEEYEILKPLFDAAADKDVSYDEAVAIFKGAGFGNPEQYKKAVDLMVDLIGLVSEELKNAIVTFCFLICAIDGEISKEEKDWIKQLVDDNFGMSPMEQVYGLLDEAKTFVLATNAGNQPKMRVLGFKCLVDGKIFFAVGTFKEVYDQLITNPNCEILANLGMSFLRWDGKAVFYEDPRFMQCAQDSMPQVVEMYKRMGAKLAFFTLEEGTAEVVGVDNSKEKIF